LPLWTGAHLIEFLPSARGDMAAQARLIVGFAVLRVLMVALAAVSGRADIVFAMLVLYALIKLTVGLHDMARHEGLAMLPLDRASLRSQLVYVVPFGLSSALFLLRGQADQWVAATMFPAAAFAAFSIGAIVMQVTTLVRNSVTFSISARLSRLQAEHDEAGMLRLNQRANIASAVVLLPTLVLFAVLADHIVTVVYTARYAQAAVIIRINALALAGVAVEVTTVTIALNQGRYLLRSDVFLLLLGIASGVLGASLLGIPGAALGNVVTLAAGNAYGFWRVAHVTGVPVRQLQQWALLLRILLAALCAGAATLLLDRANLLDAPLAEALLLGAAFAPAYALMLRLTGALGPVLALFGRGPRSAAAMAQR
jgi:O-antigen/teichoic acid export membrane protein